VRKLNRANLRTHPPDPQCSEALPMSAGESTRVPPPAHGAREGARLSQIAHRLRHFPIIGNSRSHRLLVRRTRDRGRLGARKSASHAFIRRESAPPWGRRSRTTPANIVSSGDPPSVRSALARFLPLFPEARPCDGLVKGRHHCSLPGERRETGARGSTDSEGRSLRSAPRKRGSDRWRAN
jgi:hypothetical protein